MKKNSRFVFDGMGLVSCFKSCSNGGKLLLVLFIELETLYIQEKNAYYYSRPDKLILLHDSAPPHVIPQMETSWKRSVGNSYLTRCIHQRLSLPIIPIPIDDTWPIRGTFLGRFYIPKRLTILSTRSLKTDK